MSYANLGALRSRIFNLLVDSIGEVAAAPALQSELPSLIQLAEDRIVFGGGVPGFPMPARPVRHRALEISADVTFVTGVGPLPADYAAPRRMYWSSGTTGAPAEYVTPEEYWATVTTGAYPNRFTLEGGNILISPRISGTGRLLYYRKPPAMVAASDTTPLLTARPELYLHGVMTEIYRHLGLMDRALASGAMYLAAVEAANSEQIEARHVNGPLAPMKRWAR